jgi:hypothetical protein
VPVGAAAPAAGAAAQCLVRPENLRPAGPVAAGNGLAGEIEAVRMTGATVGVTLRTPSGPVRATVLSAQHLALARGQTVRWAAAPDDTVLIPAGGAPA